MSELNKFDSWFDDSGPAALVIREKLIPVEGEDGVFFPATYAAQQGADRDRDKFQGGYNIDTFPDGTNVCLVDSVGSQANRIEPLFTKMGYSDLVPQIVVTFPAKGLRLNLLNANHRAADAIIRCSAFEQELRTAFQEVLRGNAEKLAQLAPTSLVFGVWDSRDTSAKLPRLLSSTIRAFNIRNHTRSANFLVQMTIDLAKLDILPGADSKDGFANALASKAPGGVQLGANGAIRRDTTISLAALRRLAVLEADGRVSVDRTKALRRYILGLSLVALTAPIGPFLRQGCNLVPDIKTPRDFKLVNLDGSRPDFILDHKVAVEYAREAKKELGIDTSERAKEFDATIAEKAGEAKPEKLNGAEVVSVDAASKKFKVKHKKKELEVSTNADTVIKKGKEPATFEVVVTPGAKLDLEVLNSMASTMVRCATATVAERIGWPEADILRRIQGHGDGENGQATTCDRLQFLPLPSITPNGVSGIRRVLVVGPPGFDLAPLRRRLNGEELIDEKSRQPVAMLSGIPTTDRNVMPFVRAANTWSTVTPVILPGYDDPDGLRAKLKRRNTAEEQKHLLARLDARILALIWKAFHQAEWTADALAGAEVEYRAVGWLRGLDLAANYDLPPLRFPRYHVRVRFQNQIRGPLVIGGGRWRGLGVFAAEDAT